jgi:HK97 gp10 family phage protein
MAIRQLRMEGLKELEKALLELSTKKARQIARKALRDAGKPILKAYKEKTEVLTGTLLKNTNLGTRLNRRQRKLTPRPGPSEIEIYIGTADPAGIAQEFGNRHQQASPALTPAWDAEGGPKALERIAKALGQGIERESARRARGGG